MDDLLPQQLGVGTPGGVEPLVALLRSRLTEANSEWACIQLDFVNAFNSIHRHVMAKAVHKFCPTLSRFVTWAYSSSSWLSVSGLEEPLLSEQGVRQGDAVGSYLFSLGIRPTMEKLEHDLRALNIDTWIYIDDGFVFCKLANLVEVKAAIESFFEREQPVTGLRLNVEKTLVITPDLIANSGVEVLGTAIGCQEYRRQFLRKTLERINKSLHAMKSVSKQSALILLRQTLLPSVGHLLRNLEADDIQEEWGHADKLILDEVRRLMASPSADVYSLDTLRSLPFNLGGLGLPAFSAVRQHAFAAASSAATKYLRNVERSHLSNPTPSSSHLVQDESPSLSQRDLCAAMWKERAERLLTTELSPEHKELFLDNRSQTSYAWMLALPLRTMRDLKLKDRDVSVGLTTRVLNPGFVGTCACGAGHTPSHDLSCRFKSSYRTSRHENLKRLFADVYRTCHCQVRTEPLSENSTSRDRADLSVLGPAALGGYCVLDISVVSPLSMQNHTISRLLEDRHRTKVAQYVNQFQRGEFHPVVMTVGGTLHTVAGKVLEQIAASGYNIMELKMKISVSMLKTRSEHWYIDRDAGTRN